MSENSFYQVGQKDRLIVKLYSAHYQTLEGRCVLIGLKLDFRSPFWHKRYLWGIVRWIYF